VVYRKQILNCNGPRISKPENKNITAEDAEGRGGCTKNKPELQWNADAADVRRFKSFVV
jgi:hypothetical protein